MFALQIHVAELSLTQKINTLHMLNKCINLVYSHGDDNKDDVGGNSDDTVHGNDNDSVDSSCGVSDDDDDGGGGGGGVNSDDDYDD